MHYRWIRSIFASMILGLPFVAMAQDAPAVHGFNDLTFKNDYITPRGLLVTNKGFTIQSVNGFAASAYHAADGPLNDITFVSGIFNDLNPDHQNSQNRNFWNELDGFAGFNFNFYKDWLLGAQYVAFISPGGQFKTENNLEFSLGYDDGGRWFAPLAVKPYAKLFFTASGGSTVVLGQVPSFDVELGAIPTWDLHPYQLPVIFTFPTWITVGPSNFWGGSSNVGVFSTGIAAKVPLAFAPLQFGEWSFNVGVQYYNLINSQLRNAQEILGVVSPGSSGYRNIFVFAAGLGFHF
ncbi:MAG: hypothetical protein WCA23_31470 [Stellaceae bacterium]